MMTYYRAWENQRFVRGLLREKQPELAAALEAAVRETRCPLCAGSRCSQAGEPTLPRASQARAVASREYAARAGRAGGRPACPRSLTRLPAGRAIP
jgi:hypothetical protein